MWVFFAFIGQFILGTSALADKALLKRAYPSPIWYTFWIAILGLASMILIPFGFSGISLPLFILAFLSAVCFIFGLLFYFKGLFIGKASNVVILLFALIPIFTLIFSGVILETKLLAYQIASFVFLVGGGILLFLSEHPDLRWKVFRYVVAGAFFIGLSNVFAKIVYDHMAFLSGFIWVKICVAIIGGLFLLFPKARSEILHHSKNKEAKFHLGYIANRAYAGGGNLILHYAIDLGIPSLVDATASLQFVVLFFGGWLLLKERYSRPALVAKFLAVAIVIIGIAGLSIGEFLRSTAPSPNRQVSWGVTFSQKFAVEMGLDTDDAFRSIIEDLGAKKIRLAAYWDLLEKEPGSLDFNYLDAQLDFAKGNGVSIVLAVGQKLPRWPECHIPDWVRSSSPSEREEALISYISAVVDRYKDNPAILYWQIENEPFLPFGECVGFDQAILDKEISTVRKLDPERPILVTDSGEIGRWYKAARRGDVFGTTMYRRVHNDTFGNIDYRLPPEFFRIKEFIVRKLLGDNDKEFIVIELAAEPWLKKQLYETSLEDQFRVFDLAFFKDTVRYAKETGFPEYYLWGVEWWYWLKENKNHPEFWEYAKTLF